MASPAVARLYASTRVGIGIGLALAPTAAARPWVGGVAGDADARAALRVLGVRDALLGAAVLGAPEDGASRRRALLLCAAADTADALVNIAVFRRTRRPGAALAAVTAVGGALVGVRCARRVPAHRVLRERGRLLQRRVGQEPGRHDLQRPAQVGDVVLRPSAAWRVVDGGSAHRLRTVTRNGM